MKRLLAFFLSLNILLTSFTPILSMAFQGDKECDQGEIITRNYSYNDIEKLTSEPAFDYEFLPASPKWLDYVGSEQPATFAKDKITFELADNVVTVNNKTVSDSIADKGQILSGSTVQKLAPGRIIEKGGYISKEVLDTATGQELKNGSVVVDKSTGTAFKVVSPTVYSGIFDSDPELLKMMKPLEDTYSIAKPELHEVVKKFELKEDTVSLNKANITKFAPKVESSIIPFSGTNLAVGDDDKKFKYLTDDNLIELDFKNTSLSGKVGNSSIFVELSGGIAIGGINLTGRYSRMGGYEISMTLQQECYLVATLDAEVHEEIMIPILGLDIPFGVGRVYGGIFAIIGMDGTIRLDIEARETNSCKMGIKGGTFLYVPTSFNPIFEPEPPKITGDCGLNGKINGYIKFGPVMGLEILGFDVVGAGVLLGAGVNVESDGSMLDVELYASIDVYVKLLDKHFNLLAARPTIYKKQQPDMSGYRVSFLEAYVYPGRVGGLIEEEPSKSGGAYLPSVGLEYKIWIIPNSAIGTFDVAKREDTLLADSSNIKKALKEKVRTYPDSAFAKTNAEGEFYEVDKDICYEGDQVWLEYKGKVVDKNGKVVPKIFFVGPVTPTLPFKEMTITYADYFNDYITGKVEPKRLIDWEANRLNPDEVQTELTYYQGPIFISPFNDYGMEDSNKNKHFQYNISGTARTDTNSKGEFDTRKQYTENGKMYSPVVIDVLEQSSAQSIYYENGEKKYSQAYPPQWIGVKAYLQINGKINSTVFYKITPAAPEFQITRALEYVEGSDKKITDGSRIIDQREYNEYIWIANPNGTRAITADMLQYYVEGFTSQDFRGYNDDVVKETRSGPITLTPVLNEQGNPTGAVMFAQRVTVQWVWQSHPNPIKITSANKTTAESGIESTFQVKSNGYFPRFSLEGAPNRVWIDENTGLLHVTQTVEPGTYTFTIHAKEGIALASSKIGDPKKGNDASPPDKQIFTLTVTGKSSAASSSQTSNPPLSVTPKPDDRKAPIIYVDEYNTYFEMDGNNDLTVAYKASGSNPITWSITAVSGHSLPSGITINASTGVLTIKKSLADGLHYFAVKASNDAGFDTHECTAVITHQAAPVFESRRDGYQFKMFSTQTNFSVQIKATGSAPISYTLEAVNNRLSIPTWLSINATTGLLSVKSSPTAGIPVGVYDFIIKASNSIGSDKKGCKIEVTASSLTNYATALSSSGNKNTAFITLETTSNINKNENTKIQTVVPDLFSDKVQSNKLTILCDDKRDVYTHDRDVYNGAYFMHWDTRIVITTMKLMNTTYSNGHLSLDGESMIYWTDVVLMNDHTPSCDQYHYYSPGMLSTLPLTEEELAKIKADIKKANDEEIAQYKNGYQNANQNLGADDILEKKNNFIINPMDKVTSSLEYGSLVDEINIQKGGVHNVDLNSITGTIVTGEYFAALKNNSKASVTFKQDGANITFEGVDVKTANTLDLIDIGFTFSSHEKTMLDSVGISSKSFAYAFQHHGELPGVATFAVNTTLTKGTKANVYKFDASTNKFTLIAKGLTVGEKGVVTYKNNTMSEYLITAKTIPNAEMSDMIGLFDPARGVVWWVIGICLLSILAGATVLIFIKKRKRP